MADDKQFIISKAVDEEMLDVVKQLIALEDHLSDDGVRTTDPFFQKEKDNVREMRKALMRKLLHAPEKPPSIEVRRKLINLDCEIKHLCLCFVILTEICDLLSRADRDKEVAELLGFAKNLNNTLLDYIDKARNILEGNKDQSKLEVK